MAKKTSPVKSKSPKTEKPAKAKAKTEAVKTEKPAKAKAAKKAVKKPAKAA